MINSRPPRELSTKDQTVLARCPSSDHPHSVCSMFLLGICPSTMPIRLSQSVPHKNRIMNVYFLHDSALVQLENTTRIGEPCTEFTSRDSSPIRDLISPLIVLLLSSSQTKKHRILPTNRATTHKSRNCLTFWFCSDRRTSPPNDSNDFKKKPIPTKRGNQRYLMLCNFKSNRRSAARGASFMDAGPSPRRARGLDSGKPAGKADSL